MRHISRTISLLLLALLTLPAFAAGAGEALPDGAHATGREVGRVTLRIGEALVERGGRSRPLARGDTLFEGEVLHTGEGARLVLTMVDEGVVTLGAESRLVLRRYRLDGEGAGADLEFVKGVFRAVTGLLTRRPDPHFQVHTPVATIGVRGTDFWGGFLFTQGELDVVMLAGKGVWVANGAGRAELTLAGAGTTVGAAERPPSPPRPWSAEKLRRAQASVALPEGGE